MRKGLFIGINDYTHVSRLSGCSNDAMAMASVLKTDANGDPNFKNIVLTSAEDYLSREKLEDQIRELFSGDCNVALLYFAGHGSFDTDTDEGMLIPQDYKSAKDGIRLSDILNWASKATKIKNKVIILDCCQSGSAGELRALRSEGSVVGEGMTILTACKKEEPAMEGGQHGVFTPGPARRSSEHPGQDHTRQPLFVCRQRPRRLGTAPGVQDQRLAVHFPARSVAADPQGDPAQTPRMVCRSGVGVPPRPQL
jgi:uncharacterized caspase-like protein